MLFMESKVQLWLVPGLKLYGTKHDKHQLGLSHRLANPESL